MAKRNTTTPTLRDEFALRALAGVLVTVASRDGVEYLERVVGGKRGPISSKRAIARLTYDMADAMLAERAK